MKKFVVILLAVLCVISCISCGNSDDTDEIINNTDAPTITDAPETDAPETDAPATDAPETDAPAVTPEAVEMTARLLPIADTYVVNDSAKTTDFGNEDRLRVKKDDEGQLTRNAFLKFDLSKVSLESVNKAVIRIECQYLSKNEADIKGRDVNLYATSSDWQESSFNWDTQPAVIEKIADVESSLFVGYQWVEIDVTDYLKAHMGETVTFLICNEGVSSEGNYLDFNSSEKAGHEPQLVIVGMGIPDENAEADEKEPEVKPIVGGSTESWMPIADTYVESKDGYPTDNGSAESLMVKKADAKNLSRNIYLKFNTSKTSVTDVTKATILLYCTYVSKDESEIPTRDMNLYAVSSDWSESSFNWANQPATIEKVADIESSSFVAWQWIEIDVTDYVKAHIGETISFALKNEGVDSENNHLTFFSRTKEGFEPQLVIE